MGRRTVFRYRYRWRTGNRFRLLVDGEQFYSVMLESIHRAHHVVAINLYLFISGRCAERWIDALTGAARRGVRVYLLLDDFGTLGLSSKDRRRLDESGVHIAMYNRLRLGKGFGNFLRDHRKLVWIDGRIAFTGGFGITDEFDPQVRGDAAWHELAIEISGKCVQDWGDAFARDWLRRTGHALQLPQCDLPPGSAELGHVSVNLPGRIRESRRALIRQIRRARRRVWISTAYFVPPRRLRSALAAAARRGVDVRLLVPGPVIDHEFVRHLGSRSYETLLRNGARIFEYQPRFLHAKAALCDNWVSVGSSNFDHWTLRWTLDANQEVRSRRLTAQLAAVLKEDFSKSTEVTYAAWRARPWHAKLRERLVNASHAVVSFLSYRRRVRLEIRRRRIDARSLESAGGG